MEQGCDTLHALDELPDEPGLSDAGGSEEGDQVERSPRHDALERARQCCELPPPADERRVEAKRPSVNVREQPDEPVDARREGLDLDELPDELMDGLAEKDLAGSG